MPKPEPKDWKEAKDDAGKYADYIESLRVALANAPDSPEARGKALWAQLFQNGNDMLAKGATVEDLLAGAKHMVKFQGHYRKAIKEGV